MNKKLRKNSKKQWEKELLKDVKLWKKQLQIEAKAWTKRLTALERKLEKEIKSGSKE
jgi:hypothetical protein